MTSQAKETVNGTSLPEGYSIRSGDLFLHDFNLAALARYWLDYAGFDDAPLTIRYLPNIRTNYARALSSFQEACRQTGYTGEMRVAYASKANPHEAVIRTALKAGADYECSSRMDGAIIRTAIDKGWLKPDRFILANGFKTARYANELISLASHSSKNITPIFDSINEIPQFAGSGIKISVGLRYRVPGHIERFGMEDEDIAEAARQIAAAPNLTLTTFHALQQYPALNNPEHMQSLERAYRVFQGLRPQFPSLHWFDIGGGLPAQLSGPNDLVEYLTVVQRMVQKCCGDGPLPGLIIESGRYLAGSHELKVFAVSHIKMVNGVPNYIVGGSIMSNLPDAWALNLEFPLTALNYLDTPMQQAKLAGLTCDPDDVYPHVADHFVNVPVRADGLLVAFMDIGAYQDMLGGEGGAQHCLLSEGSTVMIGYDEPSEVTYQPPQSTETLLMALGYERVRHRGKT